MRPVLFHFLGYPVGSYGVFIALAHLASLVAFLWIARSHHRPIGPFLDIIIAVVILGIIGARLGYAYNNWGEFRDDPWRLTSLTRGGLSFYGGFPLAFFGFVLVAWWRKVPVLETGDLLCPLLPFAIGLIRIGCFLEGCCYGAPTNAPWGVVFAARDSHVPPALLGLTLHPTQLYEATFLFLLSAFLALVPRNRLLPGVLATFSIFAYSVYRLVADQFRGDLDRGFWGISWMAPTQAAAVLGILATPVVLLICVRYARRA